MSSLPKEIIALFQYFSSLFSRKIENYAQQLVIGAILCPGIRTVASVLRILGLGNEKRYERYHRVLNRAKWSSLRASQILLGLVIRLLPPEWPIIIGIDDTLERRKGKRIEAKGSYRDAIRSSDQRQVMCYGLRWISMMLIVPLPWSSRPWALPFLTVLAPSKQYHEKKQKRHKTLAQWSRQMMHCVARWLKGRRWILLADGNFACSWLALACMKSNVVFISRLPLNARLFEPRAFETKVGRPSRVGKRLPPLEKLLQENKIVWQTVDVTWYQGIKKTVLLYSASGVWYAAKSLPVGIRWVLVQDPKTPERIEAFFSTDVDQEPEEIIERYVLRWNVEVTFQESRRHLGVETQRQWSEKAIARTTPVLLGLYSFVCLAALALKMESWQVMETAWYTKNNEAAYSDVIAFVRRKIWSAKYFLRSHSEARLLKLERGELEFIINQLANTS